MKLVRYEGGSIYIGNTLITQPTGGLEFYTLNGTKDQGLTFSMVDRIFFYLSYLFSYRLLNQSRTNGPINAHLTIAQVMHKYNQKMKNKKHCCKSFVKMSAVAQQ